MPDGNSPILRYAFAAVFIAACLYNLQLGVRVAGVYLIGLSAYQLLLGKVPLVDMFWKTSGYLTGKAATVLSAGCIVVGMIFCFCPDLVIGTLSQMRHPVAR
jgi:hypothetical protein